MAFKNPNDVVTGRIPVVFPAGAETVTQRFAQALETADLAANKCGAVGLLPAGCVPLMAIVDTDDLDSGAGLVLSVGLIKDDESDLDGTAWATGATVGQTGGVATLALSAAALRLASANKDRKVGFKVTTAAATAVAGTLGLTLVYRPV